MGRIKDIFVHIFDSQHVVSRRKEQAVSHSSGDNLTRDPSSHLSSIGYCLFLLCKAENDEYVPPRSVHLSFCLLVSLGSLDLSELFLSHLSNCYLGDQPYLLEPPILLI